MSLFLTLNRFHSIILLFPLLTLNNYISAVLSATGEEESVQSYLKKSSLWLTQRKDSEEPVHRNKLQNWNFSERCVSMFCTSDRYILVFFWFSEYLKIENLKIKQVSKTLYLQAFWLAFKTIGGIKGLIPHVPLVHMSSICFRLNRLMVRKI